MLNTKILIIGSINMDISITTDKIPKLGETLVGKGFSTQPGGKGANQAIAVSRLGGNAVFFGAVGSDFYGTQLIKNLKKNNVDFMGKYLDDIPTGVAVITVCQGDNCIILNSGANEYVTNDMIEDNDELFESAEYVVLQLEIPINTVLAAAKKAKMHNCKTVLNPAPYKELPTELFKYIDIIIPNEHEAAALTGIEIIDNQTAIDAVNIIMNLGFQQVIITLGDKGCVYNINRSVKLKNAQKACCIDTTAAGDTFIGGLVAKLSQGASLEASIEFATIASSITVSRYGASDSIPFANEICMV